MITERLHRILEQIEQLPPELQEDVADQLEVWTEPEASAEEAETTDSPTERFAGIWRDRADLADMVEELDRMRHETPPSPPKIYSGLRSR